MRKIFFSFLILSILASCVPNKDLIYLQGKPLANKEIRKLNNEPYKLQVDDIITIDVRSTDENLVKLFKNNVSSNSSTTQNGGSYFTGNTVDRHGNIRLPYLGEINVLGYTTREVRSKIEENLLKFFKSKDDFFVTVKLDGIRYTVMGEVAAPGPNVIYQNQVSIIDAITNSGDITITGNRKNVQVIRFTPSGETQKFEIDLTNINAVNSEVFYIKPKDLINVMPLKQKSWGTGTTGIQSLTTIVSLFTLVTSTILIVRGL